MKRKYKKSKFVITKKMLREDKARSVLLSTKEPFWCSFNHHSWSVWVYSSMNINNDKGKVMYVKTQQKRICTRCGLDQRRYVND